jgi:hypothetical protein
MSRVARAMIASGQPEPLLMDVQGLARMLSCNVRTASRMRAAGQLPTPVRLCRVLTRWDHRGIASRVDSLKGGRNAV